MLTGLGEIIKAFKVSMNRDFGWFMVRKINTHTHAHTHTLDIRNAA